MGARTYINGIEIRLSASAEKTRIRFSMDERFELYKLSFPLPTTFTSTDDAYRYGSLNHLSLIARGLRDSARCKIQIFFKSLTLL